MPLLMQAQSHFCKCRAVFCLGDIPTSLGHLSLLLTLLSIRNLILLVPNHVLFLPQHKQKDRVPRTGEWTDCCPLNLAISFLALIEAAVCAQSCVLHSCPAKMWFFNRKNTRKTWICFFPHRNITVQVQLWAEHIWPIRVTSNTWDFKKILRFSLFVYLARLCGIAASPAHTALGDKRGEKNKCIKIESWYF